VFNSTGRPGYKVQTPEVQFSRKMTVTQGAILSLTTRGSSFCSSLYD